MANLSQQKREQMIAFLEKLRMQHNDDESLMAFNLIEKELTSKKYGLVWEDHEENVDEMMKDFIPVFKEDIKKRIVEEANNENFNFLLEGDNLHSLKLLEKTHRGKVKIIYIDPPYNTGNKDFKYADAYVGSDDGFIHSKWLSFMNSRLRIAQKLLTNDGAIFISIDDHELSNLTLLCNEIFGEKNFVGLMTLQSNPRGSQNSNFLSYVHEYVLMYAKNIQELCTLGVAKDEESLKEFSEIDPDGRRYRLLGLRKRGGDWKKEDRPNMFFPIYIDPNTSRCSLEKTEQYSIEVIPKRPTGELSRWTWGKDKFLSENECVVGKPVNRKGEPDAWDVFRKDYIDGDDGVEKKTKLKTIWVEKEINYQNARNELKAIFGNSEVFSYPKPTYLIKRLISIIKGNEDAIILDFFAGSGSTGQAVLEMNKEDGGNRRFILCTNNENNICEEITYPRLKVIMTGKKANGEKYEAALPSNLKYYVDDFVNKAEEELSDSLLAHVKEMIELQYAVNVDGKKYVMIMDDDDIDQFERNFSSYKDLKAVFINQDVLLSASQEKLLEDIEVFIIPDCYFDFELREAGELW